MFFCVTETWLSEYIYDCEILPSDFFYYYRKDRHSRGGGVLVAVNKSIYSSQLPSPSDLEMVSIMLSLFYAQCMFHLNQAKHICPLYSVI